MSVGIKKFTNIPGGAVMLNTYRVISLSLVTALFFAAPLLCVYPISSQIKKAKHIQAKRVRVVSQSAGHHPQINTRNVSAAWARTIHRSGHEICQGKNPVSTRAGDERLCENYRNDWDTSAQGGGIDAMETVSYSDL